MRAERSTRRAAKTDTHTHTHTHTYVTQNGKSWILLAKIGFCRQKSKFLLFSHEILRYKKFQMTYYLFIYDIPNRCCVIFKYSIVENYILRKTQSKFGKYAPLATLNYSKAIRM